MLPPPVGMGSAVAVVRRACIVPEAPETSEGACGLVAEADTEVYIHGNVTC